MGCLARTPVHVSCEPLKLRERTFLNFTKHTAGCPQLTCNWRSLSCLSAETPIEEFTPTPAFPALQYLESVDVEGVAWRAGLRTGDFLIEVSLEAEEGGGANQYVILHMRNINHAGNYLLL